MIDSPDGHSHWIIFVKYWLNIPPGVAPDGVVGAAAKSEESGRIDATVSAIPRNLWDFCIEEGEDDFIKKIISLLLFHIFRKKAKK